MTALRFSPRAAPEQRLDLSPLVPARLAGLSAAEIERLPMHTTRAPLCVGDVFRVAMGEAEDIVIEGGSARFDRVGEAMASGSLVVEGDAGLRAGRAMTGGALTIRGNAGHWAASGLRGGAMTICGDAGDFLGGPLAGERAGMAGGSVIVRGRAGERAGDRLRRGLIVIEGDAGEAAGSRMIAGTLVVCGTPGPLAGFLMRRGTLLLGTEPARGLLPSFVPRGWGFGGIRAPAGRGAASAQRARRRVGGPRDGAVRRRHGHARAWRSAARLTRKGPGRGDEWRGRGYFRSACDSCSRFIFDRPAIPRRLASAYSAAREPSASSR